MGSEKTRQEWRRAVQRSLLPSGVKLMLTKHSEASNEHHHDDAVNLHAIKRDRLASVLGVHESTVRRQFRTAERTGWLQRHEDGHNGRQQTYHYVRPQSPWPCAECDQRRSREASREAKLPLSREAEPFPYSPPLSTYPPAAVAGGISRDLPGSERRATTK